MVWFSRFEKFKPGDMAYSALFFPVVGALLGLVYWTFILTIGNLISRDYLALILITLGIVITGAMHEDGVADVFDGFGSQSKKVDILRVMKDSRIGTYGSLALIILIFLKFLLLRDIDYSVLAKSVFVAQVLPRWVILPVMRYLPYGRQNSKTSKSLVEGVLGLKKHYLVLSSLFVFSLTLLVFGTTAFLFIAGVIIVAFSSGFYFWKKIQGITGDCLGTIEQLSELMIYILAAALL